MKVLLYNADSSPALIETSEQEKLLALCVKAFGLITGASERSPQAMQQWVGQVVAVVGQETLVKAYPALSFGPPKGSN